MKVFALTDIGKVRTLNEDAFLLPGEGETFCAVADGMGGENAGEVASALAIGTFAQALRRTVEVSRAALGEIVNSVNLAVYECSESADGLNGMGTTLTALVRKGDKAYIAHVGDSRCYRIRAGKIEQLTKDHSYVQDLVDYGMITPEEARFHPRRNLITRAIGPAPFVEPQLIRTDWRPGDVFFLCTDGLINHVDPEDIEEVAREERSWPDKLRRLISYALEDGGTDNITALFALRREDAQ